MNGCTIEGCPGFYERREVTHTVKHAGDLVVIDRVPADVCTICGDVLFDAETVRGLEEVLARRAQPVRMAPVYDFGERQAG